jgi:uncharacterized protein (UPF0332 family)
MSPFDWNQFLTLAQTLSQMQDEASLRSAVSRAYYCAFNTAMARAEAAGYRPKADAAGGMHDLLWQLYGRNEDRVCQEIFLLGARMKLRRTRADYKLVFPRPRDGAREAVNDANQCLRLISRLGQGLPQDVPRRYSY